MSLTFYATVSYGQIRQDMPDVPYLLPASSWYRGVRRDGSLPPPNLPAQITEVAADCGGFVAAQKWGGVYPYTPEQYVDWLRSFPAGKLTWAAMMDLCCEQEITGQNEGVICQRQDQTTAFAQYRKPSLDLYPIMPFYGIMRT